MENIPIREELLSCWTFLLPPEPTPLEVPSPHPLSYADSAGYVVTSEGVEMTTSSTFPPPNCLLAVLTKQNLTTLLVIINMKLQLETLLVLL